MPTKHLLAILMLCGAAATQARQEEAVCAPLAAPAGRVGIQVNAIPGDYTLWSSTNLSASWTVETNLVVGPEGSTNASFPILGRSLLYLRAAGFATPTGAAPAVQFRTFGSLFAPAVAVDELLLASLLWTWSDTTTSSNYPEASRNFGFAAPRTQALDAQPLAALTALNLGFDESDGGETTPLAHREPQNVSALYFPAPLPGLRYFAASYNPLTNTLDFAGCANLEAVECYLCETLQHVVLTNLPNLKRVCLEDADLQELDLSGNPALEDLRGALNAYTQIVVDRGTGPAIRHWCTRDNPQLTQSFQNLMTNFFALRELFIWNDNQFGLLAPVSTHLQYLYADDNHYTAADFSGQSQLAECLIANNELTNLVLAGCTSLQVLDAHANQLGTQELDGLLAFLDDPSLDLYSVDLYQNAAPPSAEGFSHYSNIFPRVEGRIYVDGAP
jgi:hypothetical protein